jgi:hypothetical protein
MYISCCSTSIKIHKPIDSIGCIEAFIDLYHVRRYIQVYEFKDFIDLQILRNILEGQNLRSNHVVKYLGPNL